MITVPALVPRTQCLLAGLLAGLALSGTAHAQDDAVPAFTVLDSMQARVQGCVTCHGQDGQGTANGYFPRIAGKPAGYLYNQLAAFRDGTRNYPPMNYLVATLPDAYLREIADHFAKAAPRFNAPQTSAVDAAVLARGKTLATAGDGHAGVPACTACHGAALTGVLTGIPGLVGVRPNYIAAQLTSWRVGNRHAPEPDCMRRVATRLSDADIGAVAAWLSRQVPPADASPVAASPEPTPLACGSQGAVGP